MNQFICDACPKGKPFRRPVVTTDKATATCERCGQKMRRITGKGNAMIRNSELTALELSSKDPRDICVSEGATNSSKESVHED